MALTLTHVETEEPTSDSVEEKMAQRWPTHITHLRQRSCLISVTCQDSSSTKPEISCQNKQKKFIEIFITNHSSCIQTKQKKDADAEQQS